MVNFLGRFVKPFFLYACLPHNGFDGVRVPKSLRILHFAEFCWCSCAFLLLAIADSLDDMKASSSADSSASVLCATVPTSRISTITASVMTIGASAAIPAVFRTEEIFPGLPDVARDAFLAFLEVPSREVRFAFLYVYLSAS